MVQLGDTWGRDENLLFGSAGFGPVAGHSPITPSDGDASDFSLSGDAMVSFPIAVRTVIPSDNRLAGLSKHHD